MVEPTSREREKIAFGRFVEWDSEGILGTVFFGPEPHCTFPPLPIQNVTELIEYGYLDPSSAHNDAPPAEDLLSWTQTVQKRYLEEQLEVGLVGYMVSPERSDARTRLTGVSIRAPGPIPDSLKAEAGGAFDPDRLEVDDFEILMMWD